jgi:hypothetical protein
MTPNFCLGFAANSQLGSQVLQGRTSGEVYPNDSSGYVIEEDT